MRVKHIIIVGLILLSCSSLRAQDVHFSQFFATPLFLNPAMAGHFDATYRFSGIIRRQWASVTAQPFQTFGGSFDVNKPFNINHIGAGIRLYHDYVGLSNYTTTSIAVPVAFNFRLGSAKRLSVSLAGELEYLQLSADFSKVTFDDQYIDGAFNPSWQTQDLTGTLQTNTVNAGTGFFIEWKASERKRIGIGSAIFNLAQPNILFVPSYEYRLPRRYTGHLLSSVPIGSSSFDVMPAIRFQQQGAQNELQFGTAVRYHLIQTPLEKQSLQAGVWMRTNDAIYASIGFQKNNFYAGVSYDVNISSLQVASNNLGGWELSVIYLIPTVREKTKRIRQCPDFL